ncbi:MAG TPA: hypothetical protein VOA80_12805, partial [Thermoanaerobaculia bacterium]|nr:hypothetical protein [Thermoanaerobaculia bacterium]
ERLLVAISRQEAIGPFVAPYVNRLSDALFVASRSTLAGRGRRACGRAASAINRLATVTTQQILVTNVPLDFQFDSMVDYEQF